MCFKYLFIILTVLFSFSHPSFAQDATVLEHGGTVRTVKFSPVNNSLVASAGDNHTIKLWDLRNNTVTMLRGHHHTVNTVAFSPDGQLLASGSDDWTFKLWNVPQRQHVATLEHITARGRSPIEDVVFSPDGQRLATAGTHVKLWNVSNQIELMTLPHDDWVFTIAFSPDGQLLATGTNKGTVRIWNIQSQQIIAQLEGDTGGVYAAVFSPDGRTLAAAGLHGNIKLWAVSNWESLGTLQVRDQVYELDFSPDGKVLASTGYLWVILWSVDGSRELASLTGHSGRIYGADFSADGTMLASCGDDGTVRLQNIETYLQSLQQRKMVRLIYFLPTDSPPQLNIHAKLDRLIKDVQQFYAEQMQSRGFGRKTFTFEMDTTGRAIVHHIQGRFTNRHYHTETVNKVMEEVDMQFDTSRNIYLIAVDVSSEVIDGKVCGVGGGRLGINETGELRRGPGGYAIIPAAGRCFTVKTTAHELGHAFGLAHDFRNNAYLMSYGVNRKQLSDCATQWLDVHRYFNVSQTAFNEPTTIEMLTPLVLPPNTMRLRFEVADADGLHQAQLIIPTNISDPAPGNKLHSCKSLNSSVNLIEFTTTQLTKNTAIEGDLQIIDVNGNITQQTHTIKIDEIAHVDVNSDGVVDVADLVLVASHFGRRAIRGANPNPDVNNDGFVNREDLLLVVDVLESEDSTPAAPALTDARLQRWILEAKQYNRRDAAFQRGIRMLEQLIIPPHLTETVLLPNYPNPFNPETWIPYQLAAPADISISIYAADGRLVRSLDLGHQSVGVYESRSRAAYWDGKNELGESVASGVYFYTLTAGEFSATRKMLIRK